VITFAALGYAFSMLSARNGQRVIRDVRDRLFSHLMSRSPRFFEKNAVGKLVTRVTSDVENLNELISTGVLQTLFDVVKIAGISAFLFVLSWKLALFALARHAGRDRRLALVPALRARQLPQRARQAREAERVHGRDDRRHAHDARVRPGAGRDRALCGAEPRDCKSWLATVLHFSLFFSVMDVVIRLAQVGILWLGGNQILGGALTAGLFVQFWILFGKLGDPIRELGEKYNVLQSAFSSSERIFQILDDPSRIEERPDARTSVRGPARSTSRTCRSST
jgi:ABC-type multidrug transport system fused ATPase/permease subunit